MSAQHDALGQTRPPEGVLADYRAHVGAIAQSRLRTVCVVLLAIFVMDGLYEAIARTAAFWQDFWIRLGAAALLASVIVVVRSRRAPATIAALAAVVVAAVAVDVESAMLALGPAGSAFFVGAPPCARRTASARTATSWSWISARAC